MQRHTLLAVGLAALCASAQAQTLHTSTPFVHLAPASFTNSDFGTAQAADLFPGGHMDALLVNDGVAYGWIEPAHRTALVEVGSAQEACIVTMPGSPSPAVLRTDAGQLLVSALSTAAGAFLNTTLDSTSIDWNAAQNLCVQGDSVFATVGNQLNHFTLGASTATLASQTNLSEAPLDVQAVNWNGTPAIAILYTWSVIVVDTNGQGLAWIPLYDTAAHIVVLESTGTDGIAVVQRQETGEVDVLLAQPGVPQNALPLGVVNITAAMPMNVDGQPGDELVLFGLPGNGDGRVLSRLANGELANAGDMLQVVDLPAKPGYTVRQAMAADFDADGDEDFITAEEGISPLLRICWGGLVKEAPKKPSLEWTGVDDPMGQFQAQLKLPQTAGMYEGGRTEVHINGWLHDQTGYHRVARLQNPPIVWPEGAGAATGGETVNMTLDYDTTGIVGEFWMDVQAELLTFEPGSSTPIVHPVLNIQYSPFKDLPLMMLGQDPWIEPDGVPGQSQQGQSPPVVAPPPIPE
ncbi:MAG: hypothetical protein R3F17_04815 [Planctomycetota bacterium]